jgi:sugar O-acyltransferase (sialic acid O-acetyltransferase NeuD family)
MSVPIIGLGTGGHAKVLLEILRQDSRYDFVGLLDPRQELWNSEIAGIRVLGNDNLVPELRAKGIAHAFVGIGGVGDNSLRARIYNFLLECGFTVVQTIHPHAIISQSVEIGDGSMVLAGAIINTDAIVGKNAIVNTGSIVEHDCVIGDHVHVASGARLAGAVRVGDNAHIGLGANIRQCVNIGENAIVGAGAVVVKDVEPNTIVVGVPAQVLRRR